MKDIEKPHTFLRKSSSRERAFQMSNKKNEELNKYGY
jgi:hypothetical protein